MSAIRWVSEQHEAGAMAFRVGRRGEDLVAEFAGVGTVFVTRDGRELAFETAEGADPTIVAKVRGSLVPALLRHASSQLTLHGSGVALSGRAAILLGPSGSGKSTFAADLCAEHGTELVADDTSAIDLDADGAKVTPTEKKHWLVNGSTELALSGNAKWAVAPARVAEAAASVIGLVVLVFDESATEPTLRRLRGQEALARLVPNVIRLVVDDPSLHAWEIRALGQLVQSAPVFELRRARGVDAQRASARQVAALLGAGDDEAK
jgi:serine kinase of HPr protein (carbohydrate metabolism regulator)